MMVFQNVSINTWYVTVRKRQGHLTDHVLSLKPKGIYTSKLKSLYNSFLQRKGEKNYKEPLNVEQNNYTTKIVNAYIVCDSGN